MMIEEARKHTSARQIHYRIADIALLDLPEQQFDLAFNLLVFCCLQNFDRIVRTVCQLLCSGSFFVFLIEYPALSHLPDRIMLRYSFDRSIPPSGAEILEMRCIIIKNNKTADCQPLEQNCIW